MRVSLAATPASPATRPVGSRQVAHAELRLVLVGGPTERTAVAREARLLHGELCLAGGMPFRQQQLACTRGFIVTPPRSQAGRRISGERAYSEAHGQLGGPTCVEIREGCVGGAAAGDATQDRLIGHDQVRAGDPRLRDRAAHDRGHSHGQGDGASRAADDVDQFCADHDDRRSMSGVRDAAVPTTPRWLETGEISWARIRRTARPGSHTRCPPHTPLQ
jgi:hypothetical protein